MTDIDTTPDATEDLPGELTLRQRLFVPWWLAVAAMLFLALWLWREVGIRVGRENAQSQQAEINRLVHENELLTLQVERMSGELSSLASAHVKTLALSGTSAATGKIFLDSKEKRALAFFYNLPPHAQYHVWMTPPKGAAVDAGAFSVGKSGRASLEIQNALDGATYVVTRGDANADAYLKSGT